MKSGRAAPWLPWIGTAAVAAPLTIVLHELGHLLAAHAFGFPEVALHYGSVSDGAKEAGFPLWQQGVKSAAGPLVSLGIVLACCYGAVRVGPRPWAVAPAFAAGVRSILIGVAYLVARVRQPGARGNFDEMNAARSLGLAPEFVVAANVLLLLAAWSFLVRRIPRDRRAGAIAGTVVGTFAGLALYIAWLGPWMLP